MMVVEIGRGEKFIVENMEDVATLFNILGKSKQVKTEWINHDLYQVVQPSGEFEIKMTNARILSKEEFEQMKEAEKAKSIKKVANG